MNKFFSKPPVVEQSSLRGKAILAIKIIISAFLIYSTFSLYNFNNPLMPDFDYQMRIISIILVSLFLTLPTLFVFWLKNRVILRYPKFAKIWKFLRIIYIMILIIFLGLIINSFYRLNNYNKTQQAVDFINSKKITLSDVMGQNLPPKPDQTLNDSTIAGIDANNNFIRDDVELTIFEKYPNSAKIRAAMLQYAQALQLELTQVFNSGTLVRILQKRGYGQSCIDGSISEQKTYLTAGDDDKVKEVENFVLNIDIRKKRQLEVFDKYMTAYSVPRGQQCDIDISSLPN